MTALQTLGSSFSVFVLHFLPHYEVWKLSSIWVIHFLWLFWKYTFLCKIESLVNSGPLLSLTDDVTDLVPVTFASFLIQRSSFLGPQPDCTDKKVPFGKRWELVSQMVQHFWNRLSKEFITALQERMKWRQPQRSLQVGDLTLLTIEITPPGHWPLARVTSVHPGSNGSVRADTVKTSTSEYDRPAVKLIFLTVNEELLQS